MIFVTCKTSVNAADIQRKVIDGAEHIIISSSTLPDNIVMNGGLYETDEIASSYHTLEDTFAPVGHPFIDGKYVEARNARAVNGFHVGAFNTNVRREDGRVKLDKTINVQVAMQSDKGKRLLDRINNIATAPIHTSVGVFVEPVEVDGIQTNAAGQEYTWRATNMVFDHDAILLDEEGAATPDQGVGIAVNRNGVECKASHFNLTNDKSMPEPGKTLLEKITQLLANNFGNDWADNLHDSPKPNEKDIMKDLIVNALKEAGIPTDDLSDADLLAAVMKINAKEPEEQEKPAGKPASSDDSGSLAAIVANALLPISEELAGLRDQINASGKQEAAQMIEVIVNSGKYPGMDADSLQHIPAAKLKELAGNCKSAHGLPFLSVVNKEDDSVPTEMPA